MSHRSKYPIVARCLGIMAAVLSAPTLVDMATGLTVCDPTDPVLMLILLAFLLSVLIGAVAFCMTLTLLRAVPGQFSSLLLTMALSLAPLFVLGLGALPVWGHVQNWVASSVWRR